MLRRLFTVLAVTLFALPAIAATPFWGARRSSSVDTLPSQLKPGEWIWDARTSASGPIVVVTSLTEQRAYVYRNGIIIGVATTSSGRSGYDTPIGVFTILQKDKDHRSSIYNNAEMPYTQRLTWGGVALHAGGLPGYPSSHGCVHLPSQFAKLLFDVSPMGMTVVISAEGESPHDTVHPRGFSPVDARTGEAAIQQTLAGDEAFHWDPALSPTGPVSLLLSGADKQVFVYRNGIEIGRSRIAMRDSTKLLGTHVLIVKQDEPVAEGQPAPARTGPNWMLIGVAGHAEEDGKPANPDAVSNVVIPRVFEESVYPLLTPGVTMLVTDLPMLVSTTGVKLDVLNDDPPTRSAPAIGASSKVAAPKP
jgi:hypothetical protein